jgi:subtilisin family serine protease
MRIALLADEPYCLDGRYDVAERFRFPGTGLTGVLVEGDEPVEHEAVVEECGGFEAHWRVQERSPGEPPATIEDVRALHRVPERGAGGADVHVVVTDTGLDPTHPVFSKVPTERVDVTGTRLGDTVGHGTGVAGQVVRMAPDVRLTSLKMFPDEGSTRDRYIMRAYQWLFEHAAEVDVVNMSWGTDSVTRPLDRLHDRLVARGIRDVTSAGNTGGLGGSPATAHRAFGVGACTEDGELAPFSSYNPDEQNPDVTAVGVDTRLARAEGASLGDPESERWTVASGTSFSAPAVAGMVARYLERYPGASPGSVMEAFRMGAEDIPDTSRDAAGIVRYDRTVD